MFRFNEVPMPVLGFLILLVTWAVPTASHAQPSPREFWRIEGEASGVEISWVTDAVWHDDARILWLLDEALDRLTLWRWPAPESSPVRPEVVSEAGVRAPVLLTVDPAGRLCVLDVLGHAVVRFSADGQVEDRTALAGPKLRFPKDLLITEDGRLVILAGVGGDATGVRVYAPTGELLATGLSATPTGNPRVDPMVAGGVGVVRAGDLLFSRAQAPELLRVDLATAAVQQRFPGRVNFFL